MKGSHPRPADLCPFVPRHSISQVTSFMQLGMLCFICVWTNGWGNNRDAGDLRRHRTYCDVTVMLCESSVNCWCDHKKIKLNKNVSIIYAFQLARYCANGDSREVILISVAVTNCINRSSASMRPEHGHQRVCRWPNHYGVIKWKQFHVTGPLWGEDIGHWCNPLTTASDVELWIFGVFLSAT